MSGWCVARMASWRSRLKQSAPKTLVHDLQRKLTGWTGKRWIVVVSKEEGAPTMRAQADAQQAEIERGVQSDPLVQAVLDPFPGRQDRGRDAKCIGGRRACAGRFRRTARTSEMADFIGLMKQAAQLQSKMQAMQAELDQIEVEGTAGGGMVTVTITAKGDLKAVKIDDSLLKPRKRKYSRT